jgi:DNA-binding XRE family transcriptional regulator
MHPLADYLKKFNLEAQAFAKTVGVHPNTIHAVCKHKQKPSLLLAFRIEKETRGRVTAKQLAQDLEARKNG